MRNDAERELQTSLVKLRGTVEQETYAANQKVDIANIPTRGAAQTAVEVGRETATRPGAVAREREIGTARAGAEIETKLSFADKLREAAIKDSDAQAEQQRKNLIKLTSDPAYMKGLRAEALAKHPPESSATVAQAKLALAQYDRIVKIQKLQDEYTRAVSSGDAVTAKSKRAEIVAQGFTGETSALLTAYTTTMNSAKSETDPDIKASLQATAAAFLKQAGIGGEEGPKVVDRFMTPAAAAPGKAKAPAAQPAAPNSPEGLRASLAAAKKEQAAKRTKGFSISDQIGLSLSPDEEIARRTGWQKK